MKASLEQRAKASQSGGMEVSFGQRAKASRSGSMEASLGQRAKSSQSESIKVNLAQRTKKDQSQRIKDVHSQNKKAVQSTKVSLDQLQIGESGKIIAIHTKNEHLYRKLMNLGFFPGSEVQVLQRSPAYLLQVGFTQIALDQKTCALISVLVTPAGF